MIKPCLYYFYIKNVLYYTQNTLYDYHIQPKLTVCYGNSIFYSKFSLSEFSSD